MPADVLPLHLCLAGRRVVVVGGGPVAARKVTACLAANAEVVVVAPYACEVIAADAAAGTVSWHERDYAAGDLDEAWLVVAATGDRSTDEAVERHATAQRTFCVRADDAAAGTARSPAVVRRGDLVISVGSVASEQHTADPERTIAVRNAIAESLDNGSLPLRRHRSGPGRVVLVGGGPGDPDLLTLRGRRELAAADVVVVDRLAPQAIARRTGARRADSGRREGPRPAPGAAARDQPVAGGTRDGRSSRGAAQGWRPVPARSRRRRGRGLPRRRGARRGRARRHQRVLGAGGRRDSRSPIVGCPGR